MKTLLVLITISSSSAFAAYPSPAFIASLAEKTMERLNEDRYIIKENGWCDETFDNQVHCTWEIEDTGRTNDTMHGIFEVKGSEYILVNAYEEYGC